MASTYTEGLVIELIGSGDKAGSWGDVTNNNLKSLNQGVTGYSSIDLSGESSPYTIDLSGAQDPDETTSPSRSSLILFYNLNENNYVVIFQTNSAASSRINCIIKNADSTYSLRVGTGTGSAVDIPAGYSARVYGDGSGVKNAFSNLAVDKIALGNQEVISNTVDDRVDITSSTLQIGDGSGDAVIRSDGTGSANRDLVLTNETTGSGGSIRINDATNGNIEISPHGSGKVVMGSVDIGGGEIDGTPIGANSANTGDFTTLAGTTSVTTPLVTNSAAMSITTTGSDGNISLTPNGSGSVVMNSVDIGGGEIDGTPIGANSANTGRFTTLVATTSIDVGAIESDSITSTNGTLGLSTTGGNKITLTANSSSIDLISNSSGGVNTLSGENTKVVLNTASTNSNGNLLIGQGTGTATVKPGGTGRLSISSSSTSDVAGSEAININASAGRIGLQVGQDSDEITFRVPLSSAPSTPVFQGFFHQHGFSMHESGGGYLNFSSTTGSTGNGFKAGGSNDPVEFKAKRDAASDNDTWGRIYHSGMASGDGAYVEVTSSYTGASGAAISFDISSLGVTSGDVPRLVELWVKRVSGGDDIGYSEGDWIKLESRFRNGTNDVGYGIWATNSTVNIKAYNEPNWLFAPNKSTGDDDELSTAGGWTIYVRAWK